METLAHTHRRLALAALAVPVLFILGLYGARRPAHTETKTLPVLLDVLRTRERTYKVLEERVVYDRYARVYSRKVRYPGGAEFEFDVWGRNWRNASFAVVVVVPYESVTGTFTLLREYNVAHGVFVYAFPMGQVEGKHTGVREAAAAELGEEVGLRCATELEGLIDVAAPQDKYQRESVSYFLCPRAVEGGKGGADPEERIEIVHGVTPTQLRGLVRAGAMQSNNIAAAFMALDRLGL